MFTNEEKDVLIKIISQVRITPLASDAVALMAILQSAVKKIAEAKAEEISHQAD